VEHSLETNQNSVTSDKDPSAVVSRESGISSIALHGVFVISGLSALIYQVVWQRLLMMIYGSNNESVAMVVASFLTGLGLGSLAGGQLSKQTRIPLVLIFGVTELLVGAYGLISIPLFAWAGNLGTSGLIIFGLVFLPTFLMGTTLPVLVAQQVNMTQQVGTSVSWLYFANTIGAAAGAFVTIFLLLAELGIAGTIRVAAGLNVLAALIVVLIWRARRRQP
jgi:predicted membrane-bound spermidine synthase